MLPAIEGKRPWCEPSIGFWVESFRFRLHIAYGCDFVFDGVSFLLYLVAWWLVNLTLQITSLLSSLLGFSTLFLFCFFHFWLLPLPIWREVVKVFRKLWAWVQFKLDKKGKHKIFTSDSDRVRQTSGRHVGQAWKVKWSMDDLIQEPYYQWKWYEFR